MNRAPQVILLDLGNTLLHQTRIDSRGAVGWLLASLDSSLDRDQRETLQEELRTFYAEIRKTLRSGVTEFPIRGLLNLAIELAGATVSEPLEEIELGFWRALSEMEPLPYVRDILEDLRERGIKLAVVSNSMFSRRVLQYELARHGLLEMMEFVISSADYGVQKPHPMIFQAALTQIRCNPADVWFVGDNLNNDIAGATNVGMQAVWLNHSDAEVELPPNARQIGSWQEFLPLIEASLRGASAS